MIRYLECPDLHRSPAWADISTMIENAIIKAAPGMDFVLLPGDYWEAATYNSEKGGIIDAIDFIEKLTAICPVYAIEGTPSHDARGSYAPLVKAGLRLVRPDKSYFVDNQYMIFGIPEPTKAWVQTMETDLSADSVNARITALIGDIIEREIAPARAMYPDIPAIGMFHGNVTDAESRESETDIILKASDIVIRTSTLAKAGLDRWALGHIHTPWESSKISAGYAGFAGIDRNPWGKTGFIPAMNMVTLEDGRVSIERVPYGTPMRVKIDAPVDYVPGVAYWLETADRAAFLPETVHPWSRVTYLEETETSRRVDANELETAVTLSDMAKLFKPDISSAVVACFGEIEKTVKRTAIEARSISVSRVKITGATFWQGRTIEFSASELSDGLTHLSGPNGSGKSSLAGFCTPFPGMVGKDTDSGRQSAIKDFFISQESGIEKTIICNGIEHKHVITIRGAHTKTPKTECYLSIDGMPKLEKSTFDEMMAECERLYGSLSDYLATTFYVQPLQGKAESGLMTASMTTVRDLVQNIAGINYEAEKEYALSRVRTLESEISKKTIEIDAVQKTIPVEADVQADIDGMKANVEMLALEESVQAESVISARDTLAALKVKAESVATILKRKAELLAESSSISAEIAGHKARVIKLKSDISSAPAIRDAIESDGAIKAAYEKAVTAEHEKATKQARHRELSAEIARITTEAKQAHENKMHEYRAYIALAESVKKEQDALTREAALLNKPCEHCGKLSSNAETAISALRARWPAAPKPVDAPIEVPAVIPESMMAELASIILTPPAPLPSKGLTEAEISAYRTALESVAAYTAECEMLENDIIPAKTAKANALAMEAFAIKDEPVDISAAENNSIFEQSKLDRIKSTIAELRARIATRVDLIADIGRRHKAIEESRATLAESLVTLEAWKTTDEMLKPAKIPAFELDTFLDSIDGEATRRISPYKEGRYLFQTVTQKEGIDKFDIIVLDKETGEKRSFMKYSVGQKSFFNKAYTDALTHIRKTRMRTEYSPVILDEADSFIDLGNLAEFYEMQKMSFAESKVLVITHSSDAGNYIQNHIDIGGLIK